MRGRQRTSIQPANEKCRRGLVPHGCLIRGIRRHRLSGSVPIRSVAGVDSRWAAVEDYRRVPPTLSATAIASVVLPLGAAEAKE